MRIFLILAGLMGAQAVITGAIAAHGDLSDYSQELVEKAIQYELWHTLALMGTVLLAKSNSIWLWASGAFFSLGVLFFCGSLYILGFTGNTFFPLSAPIGGSCLILGWLCLTAYGLFTRSNS